MLRILLLSVVFGSAFAQLLNASAQIGVSGVGSANLNSSNLVVKVDSLNAQENVQLNPLELHLSSPDANGTLDAARPYGDTNTSIASGGIGLDPTVGFIDAGGFKGDLGSPANGQIGQIQGNDTKGQIGVAPLNGSIGAGDVGAGIDQTEGYLEAPGAEGSIGSGGLPLHGSIGTKYLNGSMVVDPPENAFNGSADTSFAGVELGISPNQTALETSLGA